MAVLLFHLFILQIEVNDVLVQGNFFTTLHSIPQVFLQLVVRLDL